MAAPDIQLHVATEAHARALAARMRPADAAEVSSSLGVGALEAVLASMAVSEVTWAAIFDGEVAGLFGVARLQDAPGTLLGGPDVGVVWLLTSSAVDGNRRAFLRYSRAILSALLQRYPILVNAIDARHVAALRWARWLGFTVSAAVPYGVEGLPFHPISIRSPHV